MFGSLNRKSAIENRKFLLWSLAHCSLAFYFYLLFTFALLSFPRPLLHQLAVLVSETLPALLHRQLRAQHESSSKNFRARHSLARFFRRGFRRNRHARREGHDANVRVAYFLGDVARECANAVFGYHV